MNAMLHCIETTFDISEQNTFLFFDLVSF